MNALPVALVFLAAAQERRPETVTASGDELKPGLAAVYRGSDGSTLHRIDSKPSFTWGDSSPHPRIPAGPFEATWTGVFAQPEGDSIRFSAAAGGELRVTLGGVVVLDGAEGGWRPWTPGLYRIEVKYRSLAAVPARLQLWWEGKGFSREPLPPWRLRHLPAELPAEARHDLAVEKGRREVDRMGCANCHRSAFPGVEARPSGPSLEGLGVRVRREWLMKWLEDPAKEHPGARMPALFTGDRQGSVERSMLADYLLRDAAEPAAVQGKAREGRTAFLGLGCGACHFVPDLDPEEQGVPGRIPLAGLRGRMDAASLAAFLENPLVRYPDGRMPRLPVTAAQARDIAAYLLPPAEAAKPAAEKPVTAEEAEAAAQARGVGVETLGRAIMAEKRCHLCHPGLAEAVPDDLPIRNRAGGCLSGKGPVRFAADASIAEYLAVAAGEKHASPFDARRLLLERSGCARCHARDTDRPPPIEEAGSLLGGAGEASLFRMPFQRTPRLTHAHARYRRDYLAASVRDGVSGVRPSWYSYRMPAYGKEADVLVRALAEADGAPLEEADPPAAVSADPTLPGLGPQLVGFEGYSCISCHIWKGKNVAEIEHGSVGPELTGVTARLRRDWFDRWLEDPARAHPGTPMPQVFRKGQPATVESILGGNSAQQKEAFWAYLALGKAAADPKSLPAVALEATEPLVALAPIHLPDRRVVEAVGVLFPGHDFLLYDLAAGAPHGVYTGARLLRVPKDRRSFALEGTRAEIPFARAVPADARYVGFDRLADGIRVRWSSGPELLRLEGRILVREVAGRTERFDLPPARALPKPAAGTRLTDPGKVELADRPGYRLVPYPRPKTVLGEDAVMPGAIVASPKDGRVYVASMKMGDVLRIDDPKDDGREARFVNYAGLLQDAYSMVHDGESLYVLHRRNLTRVRDTDGDGRADAFDRVAALDHVVNENVDNAYGLVREPSGSFVFTHAVNTPQKKPGWGSVLRLAPGPEERREELAFGMRRAYGWCLGPEDGIFFTDNQGEWVASSKLCRAEAGRYYGYPNPGQNHAGKPAGKTAVWIPYGWARSANGLALDTTGGKFGPFAGQFFLAEMMYGGGVVRAQVEKVNGEWQGACFPFWDKGLVGPLVVAFDPKGRLWVGSITDASCGSQPDRGAVFRIDYTGELPFEIRSIHIRPRGFRLVFTRPADPKTLSDPASYLVEQFRYEYTGAYGSPELDRTRVSIERLEPSPDGRSVDLTTSALVRDRVYMLHAAGVRSSRAEPLVHPAGAYTVNEIPPR